MKTMRQDLLSRCEFHRTNKQPYLKELTLSLHRGALRWRSLSTERQTTVYTVAGQGRVNDLGGVNRMVLRNSINANTKEKEIRETVKRDL